MRSSFLLSLLSGTLLLLFLSAVGDGIAEADNTWEKGLPPLQIFRPELPGLGTQNFDISYDRRALIYVAALDGVIEFDGERWRLIPLPNDSAALCLEADSRRSRIAVGAFNEFGLLEMDDDGVMRFNSLLGDLPPGTPKPAEVWAITHRDGAFNFFTDCGVYSWSDETGLSPLMPIPELATRPPVMQEGESLLVGRAEGGINDWIPGKTGMIPGTPSLRTLKIRLMARTSDSRLFLSDRGRLIHWRDGQIEDFSPEGSAWAAGKNLNSLLAMENGRVALASQRNGILILESTGKMAMLLDRDRGLPDNEVATLALGPDGALWAVLRLGLVRIDINSPSSVIDPRLGLNGSVFSLCRHQGRLIVATSQGLWRLDRGAGSDFPDGLRASSFPDFPSKPWSVVSTGKSLLVGASDGIFELRGNSFALVPGSDSLTTYLLYPSPSDNRTIYLGCSEGMAGIRKEGTRWVFQGFYPGLPGNIRSIIELNPTQLCLGTTFDGAFILDLHREKGTLTPLETGSTEVNCHLVDGEILLSGSGGVYRLDPGSLELRREEVLSRSLGKSPATSFEKDTHDRVWVNSLPIRRFTQSTPGIWKPADPPPEPLPKSTAIFFLSEADGVFWVASDEGLFRFVEETTSAPASLRRPLLAAFSRRTGARLKEGPEKIRLAGKELRFEYSAAVYGNQAFYQYKLDPVDAEFSKWSQDSFVNFSHLPAGSYFFRLRSKAPGRPSGPEVKLSFTVPPPWYMKPWAITIWGLVLAALPLVFTRFRERKLRKKNRILSELVAEKTSDLKEAVEALSIAKGTVEEKNTLLTEANEKLQFLSECDGLTGIANRRRLDAALEGEWARCWRQKSCLSFVLIDLDRFKTLNDRHGHQAGDDCLRAVGKTLRETMIRQTDLAARYGGEEFVLLLPNTDITGAEKVAENIRKLLSELCLKDSRGEELSLTASLGVASIRPGPETSIEDLIRAADTALYRAKNNGRNQVVCAPFGDQPSGKVDPERIDPAG